ncbi:MAG: hypothetical protein ACR2MB_15770 [Acidimicrobiales bacterium]
MEAPGAESFVEGGGEGPVDSGSVAGVDRVDGAGAGLNRGRRAEGLEGPAPLVGEAQAVGVGGGQVGVPADCELVVVVEAVVSPTPSDWLLVLVGPPCS